MSDQHAAQQIPIAVVGIASLTPGACDTDAFWHTVLEGRDQLTDVPPTHWLIDDYFDPDPAAADRTYCRRGAFLSEIDFDPTAYGITPNAVPATDTAQLLALVVADRVLADLSRNSARKIDRERVSVILGTGALNLLRTMSNRMQRPVWLKALRESGVAEADAHVICDRIAAHYVPWQEATFPGVLGNVVSGRIANRFDLHGTNVTVDAACASSLAAVAGAMQELALGTADTVITGGVDTLNDISTYMCFSKTPALSPTGDCRPFSDRADGTMLGEAVVMFALRRLADAEQDGDQVYAVIRGIGSSSDGKGSAIYAPVPAGQARALERAYRAAGYGPDTVGLVEAHGTGTRAGDAAEFAALRDVFDATGRPDRQWCALGSAKSQFGHTKSAAGSVGLLKAVLAVQHKVLPPTIKVDRPNPELDLPASPFYLNTVARPWISPAGRPRRAAVSSFGFGGTNFHLTLEEYVPVEGVPDRSVSLARCAPTELILVGAESAEKLLGRARALIAQDDEEFAATARRSQREFDPTAPARLAVVARDFSHLADLIGRIAGPVAENPAGRHSLPGVVYQDGTPDPGRVAWLFSGQGSQYVGMGADLAISLPLARAAWDRVAEIWSRWVDDRPLHDVVFPIPGFDEKAQAEQQDLLTATEWAQPALAAQMMAQLAVLHAAGTAPDCVGGHSFGELVALHVAGVLDETGLVRAARRRGELMRDSAGSDDPGAMLALDATLAEIESLLADRSADTDYAVWIASENGPRQTVVSGHRAAVADLELRAAAAGLTARRLPTAAAFHTPLIAQAHAPFHEFLNGLDVAAPLLEVYGNSDAKLYPAEPDRIRKRLAEHLVKPVLFAAEIEAMYRSGVRTFVEFGAGSVLTGLVDQVLGDRPHLAVSLDRRNRHGLTTLQEGLGALAVAGIPTDLDVLWAPFQEPGSATPSKGRISMRINGANYGSPYPPAGGSAALPPPNPARDWSPAPVGPRTDGPALPSTDLDGTAWSVPVPVAARPDVTNRGPAISNVPMSSEAVPVGLAAEEQWITVFREAQNQTAELHAKFQQTIAEGHRAFLTSMERAVSALAGMSAVETTGTPVQRTAVDGPDPARTAPHEPPHLPRDHSAAAAPRDGALANHATAGTFAPGNDANVGPAVGHSAIARPSLSEADSVRTTDVAKILVEVVAEKTGFPTDVIDPHLELEADLGIDSIKRVEIFSALRSRIPELAGTDIDVATLGTLRTVDQIAAVFSATATSDDPRLPTSPRTPLPVGVTPVDLVKILVEVVVEKTGFPTDVIDPHLELEADLGIDSIKRVEIFSALRSRVPELAGVDIDAATLGSLRTVDQIASTFSAAVTGHDAPLASPGDLLASRESGTDLAETNVLARSVSVLVPAALPGLELPGLRSGGVLVTDDGTGVAARLAELLRNHGIAARVWTPPATGDCGEIAELIDQEVHSAVVLAGLRRVASIDDALEVNWETFRIARAFADQIGKAGGVLVTVQDTGGDFGLSGRQGARAWLGGLAGLTRSVRKEWSGAHAKAVDCACGSRDIETLARVLADELLRGGSQQDVALAADGCRYVLAEQPSPAAAGFPLPAAGPELIVATGGARGVTPHALRALADASAAAPVIALLGRTTLEPEPAGLADARNEKELRARLVTRARAHGTSVDPAEIAMQADRIIAAREVHATLADLERGGTVARYLPVDVRDSTGLRTALADLRAEFGPITGLVHAAGVLADGYLADKTDTQFAAVFDTKVTALRALLDATADDPLNFVCVFSSAAGRFGNAGQGDYALANEVIAQVASTVRADRPECVVRSLAWGPWDGGMVSPALRDHFLVGGTALISPAAGAAAFVREIRGGDGSVRVTLTAGQWPDPFLSNAGSSVSGTVSVSRESHPHLADHTPADQPVVPLALVAEWFLRAANIRDPRPGPVVLRDLEIVRRAKLDRFGRGGELLHIHERATAQGELGLDLISTDAVSTESVVHVRATVSTRAADRAPAITPTAEPGRVVDQSAIYRHPVLFHGPAFRAIVAVESLSAREARAEIIGVRELRWPDEPWHSDPAAVDAGLQLALLWADERGRATNATEGGFAYLPMGIIEARFHIPGPIRPGTRCVVHGTEFDALAACCDVTLVDAAGAAVVEMVGVRLVRRPDEQPLSLSFEPMVRTAGVDDAS
ncbi:SDR family NAD(P)-dependent oxidoreductase [Nocardia pseudovaccinii]|uniref:SDR family NAD(P)-dependent oxidoreductase n=1 Tax=Nocardia pseudovaccinii TaxID=189540 RepID=UPI003D8CB3AE